MIDHTIPKPNRLAGYELHRMVAELTTGASALFVDQGDHLVVRTDKPVTPGGKHVRIPEKGTVIGFELRASVAIRRGGRNIYPATNDWRFRRTWLEAEGEKLGFEIVALHVVAGRQDVVVNGGRKFWIDATQFTGVLKFVDASKFSLALANGIGRVGKAFGMGMLVI